MMKNSRSAFLDIFGGQTKIRIGAYALLLCLSIYGFGTSEMTNGEPATAEAATAAQDNRQTEEIEFDPTALFLTWQYDPTTSMTIDWHTLPYHGNYHMKSLLQFREEGIEKWREVNGAYHQFPHSRRHIHRVTLRDLEPGTTYQFRFGDATKSYRFETMPQDLSEPLRFATGGDAGTGEAFERMNRVVMEYDIDFIKWGGDIAYANGDPARIDRWYDWFDGIKNSLIDDTGKVTPIVIIIGNHELFGVRRLLRGSNPHDELTQEEAEAFMDRHNLWDGKPTYFFHLFAFPGRPAYNVLDFGEYMSILALDSNHYSDVAGGQTGWLERTLMERVNIPHVFPTYHVPAYPSHRSYSGDTSVLIRKHWVPLFEQYNIQLSFENHDHTYKRTHPIRNGEVVDDSEGIVYMGDGAWVAGPRDGNSKDEWYINQFASENHGIIVTLYDDRREIVVVTDQGVEIDSYTSYVR